MGVLNYDSTSVEFDDRTLQHLQIVIVSMFRRNQSVLLSWMDSHTTGGGRTSMWLASCQPVHFHFDGSRAAEVDQCWLAELFASAESGSGLVVVGTDGRLIRGTVHREFALG
jgi:hypothetical protein